MGPSNEIIESTTELSATMRKYLVTVYRLCELVEAPGAFVSTSAAAASVEVSAPAVNRMIGRLRDLGLVEHERYKGIRLTPEGTRAALRQLRRHRIIESFLMKVMNFDWHQVHEEADTMVTATTTPLIERMWQMAGSPAFCPYGEPIPHADGTIDDLHDVLLSAAPQHVNLVITRVRTREADRLEYLAALELVPGAQLQVYHAAPFNGPLQLKLEKSRDRDVYRIVGHNLAEMLRVRPLEG